MTIGDSARMLTKTQVSIKCPAHGLPDATVTWKKDAAPLVASEVYSFNATTLVISPEVTQASKYTCTATNRLGKDSASTDVSYAGESRTQAH